MTERDIYLTGRDIYFGKGHNFVTDYLGDEIFIMCTNPKSAFPLGPVHIVKKGLKYVTLLQINVPRFKILSQKLGKFS